LLDGSSLSGSSAYRGIGSYLRNLARALADSGEVELFALVTDPEPFEGLATVIPVTRNAPPRLMDRETRLRLPREVVKARSRYSIDVFHAPASELPARSPVPVVATLHDVVPLVVEGYEWERRRWARLASRFRAAAVVVAVSRFSADEGIRVLGLDPARVRVAHHASGPEFVVDPTVEPGNFLLFVSEYDPRKRPELAVRVLDRLLDAGVDTRLLFAGRVTEHFRPVWERTLAASAHPDRVESLGFVPQERLLELVQTARAVLVTSSYEGFGLPALEAMACGTPVVAFATSATAEVVADGGLLVPEGDLDRFVHRTATLFSDRGAWEAARAQAVARAADFSWEASAAEHLLAYRQALSTER
jgi:glycosyltransferase involved in cell wall biosynthesis